MTLIPASEMTGRRRFRRPSAVVGAGRRPWTPDDDEFIPPGPFWL